MRESFNDYKKTIERNILSIDYLYSGDINSSLSNGVYTEIKNGPLVSPSVIINCLKQIYTESIGILKSKAKEVIFNAPTNDVDIANLLSTIDSSLGHPCKYIFVSKSTYKYLGYDNISPSGYTSALPSYFFSMTKITGANTNIYISPDIDDAEDEYTVYASDKPFQSLVYSIQNMTYDTIISNEDLPINERSWSHVVNYNLYDCKFSSVKVVIKNLRKMRDDKIKEIFS